MQQFKAFLCLCFIVVSSLQAQQPSKLTSSEIYTELQRLNFLGNVLYVAAHPDDENTRMIAYLANEVKANTTYLSLTRGDGGQNLIGPELKELLGVLRTQELLAARAIDGGHQRFSRAVDFGFSKHPDETLTIWDKKEVLSDVVLAIRQLRPDVIINRFDHRTPGSTHGHHTASAMLSFEAFDLAGDAQNYPNQLQTVSTWQPKRLFFNTSWWFYGSRENFEAADKSNLISMDIGVFYPELGMSNNEIASLARSQHLCQGFGQMGTRGSETDYVEFLKGDKPNSQTDIFEGINTTWSRLADGEAIGVLLNKVEKDFNFKDPSIHLPDLLAAYYLLKNSKDEFWKAKKLPLLENIILAAAGLYIEADTAMGAASPGEDITVEIEAVNRSNTNIRLNSVSLNNNAANKKVNKVLEDNQKETFDIKFSIPNNTDYTSPYWLLEKGELGMYKVSSPTLIGLPETPAAYQATFNFSIEGKELTVTRDVVHHFNKPEKGELYSPFVILPPVTTSVAEDVILFATTDAKNVAVNVRAGKDNVSGNLSLKVPQGWMVNGEQSFSLSKKGEVQTLNFLVTPPINTSEGSIQPIASINGQKYNLSLVEIEYDHIPKQSVLLPSEAKVARLNIKKAGENIGYIVGAGDKVPESLSQIGYNVTFLTVETLQPEHLQHLDGVVLGIRAYNVLDALEYKQNLLLDYVKNGGTMIVQYNTANRWKSQFENIAPYPLTISRDRVTDEYAKVELLAKNHPILNKPNKIEATDFDGWIQERGLYFPNQWSKEFTPILSMADQGEEATKGSLLVAPYGKGHYIYTGLSFFRELPAGVPGAYKLFANMLSLGKSDNANDNGRKGN
ncbi:PIG-L family deacetylase [Croceivirga sp. JEA036]|uniref:PIG-L family deacetylase n=1 Tax=Croceivirga sp. JEA036 TaxID=2721162 RepID=UPI0014398803|nr:PIG-L family deacetylase [Croceivirga sp. JEA036]NJB35453.1 PIG-L family deacetylase [Croceivirga sp. JEA036]